MSLQNVIPILVGAFCIFFCHSANAQTYYYYVNEVPQQDGSIIIYKTLLSLQIDGTATARVQYNVGSKQKLYLYQLNLTDSATDDDVKGKRFLMCRTPSTPLLDQDSTTFFDPRFIFKKTTDSFYYVPDGVEIKDKNKKWVAIKTTENREKTFEELRNDEPFVSAFYFDYDVFYQYLFADRVRSTVSPRSEKMFLITVANTNDDTVGKSVAVDFKNWTTLFQQIAANLGITKVISVEIAGNDYTKPAVLNAIKKVADQKPSPSDIIIFYYSGHGFRLPGDVSDFSNLSFRTPENRKKQEIGDYMPLEDVYNKLMAIHPKVCLVFGDLCNVDFFTTPLFGPDILGGKGGGTLGDFNVDEAKKLFLPAMPLSLLVGSVEKGHVSLGNTLTGGYFTSFLKASLEKDLWGFYSRIPANVASPTTSAWMRILLEARKNTNYKALSQAQCGVNEDERCVQQAKIKITPE